MALRISERVLNASANAAVDEVDVGSGVGRIDFYSGSPPATLSGTPSGNLLASVDFSATAFGAASGGSASAADVPLETTGLDDGDIGFMRVLDGDGVVLWDDDDVGTSLARVIVNTTTVSTGVAFSVTSFTFGAAADSS